LLVLALRILDISILTFLFVVSIEFDADIWSRLWMSDPLMLLFKVESALSLKYIWCLELLARDEIG
jgi:hypothetical protein